MKKQQRVLNLGAGNRLIDGAVNHDVTIHRPEITIAHDLNVRPWPWADDDFDLVVARSVLEHLDIDLKASLNECWRILAPGGQLFIKLPYWLSDMSHQDPTHRWFFTFGSLDQFDPDTPRGREYAFYSERRWRIVEPLRLNSGGTSLSGTMEVRK